MSRFDFDKIIERRGTGATKWDNLPDDGYLPMWVADMDFAAPEAVAEAIKKRADHGVFGYGFDHKELRETIVNRLHRLYDWQIQPEHIVFIPGLVPSFAHFMRIYTPTNSKILIQSPVYPPFFNSTDVFGHQPNFAPLTCKQDEQHLHYEIDFDVFRQSIDDQTHMFLLCNPHNPIGRVYNREELQHMADICIENDLLILSDEIHCDLLMDDNTHIPIATLSPEIEARTITMMAPSKTFNLAGLHFGFAIITNDELREKFHTTKFGALATPTILAMEAANAAFKHGQEWLDALRVYLQGNRDLIDDFVVENMPEVKLTKPEGTYLTWLDFNAYQLPDNKPAEFFLNQAKVKLNEGSTFGTEGEGFARINFATPRSNVEEALKRMLNALNSR